MAFDACMGSQSRATATFVEIMNKWFDIVNVKHLFEGRNTRNLNLAPFNNMQDECLRWLECDFLAYLDKWKPAAELSITGQVNSQISRKNECSLVAKLYLV